MAPAWLLPSAPDGALHAPACPACLQLDLLKLLMGERRSITVVGDVNRLGAEVQLN